VLWGVVCGEPLSGSVTCLDEQFGSAGGVFLHISLHPVHSGIRQSEIDQDSAMGNPSDHARDQQFAFWSAEFLLLFLPRKGSAP